VKIILIQGPNDNLLYIHYTPDISFSSRTKDHRSVIFNGKYLHFKVKATVSASGKIPSRNEHKYNFRGLSDRVMIIKKG
jgi:hypothetical protein